MQKEIAKQTGSNLEEVKQWLQNPEKDKEQIKKAWLTNKNYDEATPDEQKQLEEEFELNWSKFLAYKVQIPEYEDIIKNSPIAEDTSSAKDSLLSLEERVNEIADNLVGLKGGNAAKRLHDLGFTAKQLKALGFSAKEAAEGGYTNKEIHDAKYTAKEFKTIPGNESIQAALDAKYTPEEAAKAYGARAAMKVANISGAVTQKGTGYTAKTIQSVINESANDKAVQADMAGVQVGKVDVNGKAKGGVITDSHISSKGTTVGANKGSNLYTADWDEKTGKVKGKWTTYTIDKLTKGLIEKYPIDAKQALNYAIKNSKVGSKINKNFKSLVSAAGIAGKTYKLKNGIVASIGGDGKIYYNNGKKGVQIWDPSAGKLILDKYNKKSFISKAKKNSNVSREYDQVLKANGVKKYASGGLANQTGPAWLDGTPSKPELVLNASDTKNFLALKDVLSKAVKSSNSVSNSYGENTYEINVNVDHISNDYDVDRMVERVKKDIIKSAGYRNVTQVRNFR